MRPLAAALFLISPSLAFAQASQSALASGYVVKVESGSVYLDFGQKSGAAAGQPFHVYAEGAELKHPVTGKSLGRVETTLAQGILREVLELYSVGSVSSSSSEIKPGMRARLGEKPLSAPQAPAAAPGSSDTRLPRWKSPVFDFAISGMALGDFSGEGRTQMVLADSKTVRLYPYPPQQDKPLAQYSLEGTAPKILSLESGDINQNGRPELFVTYYNGTFERVETAVLELASGTWKQLADIPWIVRAHQDGEGRSVLAVQQLVDDATFPFSNIYPLTYKDGKYGPGSGAIRHKRVDWIYDFTTAGLDGHAPAVLYFTTIDHLRVQFDKGYWKTPDTYGQTPTRLRWPRANGRLLEFHPPMPVAYDDAGKASLYIVRNLSMLGSLSEPFGLFNGGEIHSKSWDGVSLKTSWKTDLGGYCTGLALVGGSKQPKELAAAVVGTSGKSSVWVYDP